MGVLADIARAAIALLVSVLAIYLSLRLLGKVAKFVITAVVIALVLWFLFSDNSILQTLTGLGDKLPSLGKLFGKGA